MELFSIRIQRTFQLVSTIKRLFINVPTLSDENRIKLESKPINIYKE